MKISLIFALRACGHNFTLPMLLMILLCSGLHASGISEADEQVPASPSGKIEKISWDTAGGGDLAFEMIRADGGFSILVTRHDFKPAHRSFLLTPDAKEAFELAKCLFDGSLDPHADTYLLKPHESSGMFVTITLDFSNGHREKIKNIKAKGKLRPIYDYVHQQMSEEATGSL